MFADLLVFFEVMGNDSRFYMGHRKAFNRTRKLKIIGELKRAGIHWFTPHWLWPERGAITQCRSHTWEEGT